MKKLLYIFLVSILALACTRQQIKISAVNPATGEPYAGLNYTISKNVTGAFETNSHIVKKGVLNESGNALVTLNLDNNRSYVIGLESPGEHCYENNTSYTFSHNDKSFGFVFKIAPCAYIKLNINNINCQGVGDHFVLYSEGTQVDITNAGLMVDEMGCYQYNPSGYSKIPMGGRYYRWEVTRNGITTTFRDTAYFAEGENKTYTINY